MDLWERYFFGRHSKETLREWAHKLAIFRYFRACGGHANDGDSLDAAFKYESEEQLLSFFRAVGFQPVVFSVQPPQPVPGKSYRGDEFAAFPSIIPGTKWIQQPGHYVLFGVAAFMWCEQGRIAISINKSYDVKEEDVENAARIEPHLAELPFERIEPPVDNKHCLCPKYHPDLFL